MGLADPPATTEFEISLFGPGKGESIVLHLGFGVWAIVDSCRNSETGKAAALDYLDVIGVGPDAVTLVIASHWHDDHVRGLSDVLKSCSSAQFVFSEMLKRDQFQRLVETGRRSMLTTSGTTEFAGVMRTLTLRKRRTGKQPRQYATPNRVLWERNTDQIRSLSPSDQGIEATLGRLAQYLPEARAIKRRIGDPRPNDASVVLWVRVGETVVLLGGDLQKKKSPEMGWLAILDSPVAVPQRASLFKVPHHGAFNAHEDRVWTELLDAQPEALVTPFTPSRLPTLSDQQRICGLAHGWLTAPNGIGGTRARSAEVQAMIDAVAPDLHETEPATGHIRARHPIRGSGGWHIELFGPAHDMCVALTAPQGDPP
jgi:hypothetical protein